MTDLEAEEMENTAQVEEEMVPLSEEFGGGVIRIIRWQDEEATLRMLERCKMGE